jgi:hypothetical protein
MCSGGVANHQPQPQSSSRWPDAAHSAERPPCGGAKGGHRTTKVGKAGELLGVLEMAHQHVHSRCRLEHSLVVSVCVDTTHSDAVSVKE